MTLLEERLRRYANDTAYLCLEEFALKPSADFLETLTPAQREFAASGLVEFRPNAPQTRYFDMVRQMREAGGPVAIIILKARKWGGSSATQAIFAQEEIFVPNTKTLTLAQVGPIAAELQTMSRTMLSRLKVLKDHVRVVTQSSVRGEYALSNGSRMRCSTARSKWSAHGEVYDCVHASEGSRYAHPEEVMKAVRLAAPRARLWIEESTAAGAGGYFYERWASAQTLTQWLSLPPEKRGHVGYFVGVFDIEWYRLAAPVSDKEVYVDCVRRGDFEYLLSRDILLDGEEELVARHGLDLEQVLWRRRKIAEDCDGSEATFREQFPATAEEAWLTGERPALPITYVEMRQKAVEEPACRGVMAMEGFQEQGDGAVWMWRPPEKGRRYTLGADVATGDTRGAASTIEIVATDNLEQIAEVQVWLKAYDFAAILARLGIFYNFGWLAVDRTGPGEAVMEALTVIHRYAHIYAFRPPAGSSFQQTSYKLGIHTGRGSRPLLIETARMAFCQPESVIIRSNRLVREYAALQYHGDKIEAPSGALDDLVLAHAMALYAAKQLREAPAVFLPRFTPDEQTDDEAAQRSTLSADRPLKRRSGTYGERYVVNFPYGS